jgi:hypothetical protein
VKLSAQLKNKVSVEKFHAGPVSNHLYLWNGRIGEIRPSAIAPMITTMPRPRSAGVDLLTQADELDLEPGEVVQLFKEVLH